MFNFILHIDLLRCLAATVHGFETFELNILSRYLYKPHPNFYAYLVNADTHTFTNKDYYYTTDPSGKSSKSTPTGCFKLSTWLNGLMTLDEPYPSMCIVDSTNTTNFCPGAIKTCVQPSILKKVIKNGNELR